MMDGFDPTGDRPDLDREIHRLAQADDLSFERNARMDALKLGIPVTVLRRLVRAACKELKRAERDALQRTRRAAADAWEPKASGGALPVIRVAGGSRHANADAALAIMRTADVPFYVRGQSFV